VTRLVLYVGHPVAPTAEEIAAVKALHGQGDRDTTTPLRCRQALEVNLQRAMQWLSWLRRSFPETTFIAPWIADIQSGADDTDPAARERGIVDCCAVVERCDGIVLVGPRISIGMARERDHGLMCAARNSHLLDFVVYDLTGIPRIPVPLDTSGRYTPVTFSAWARFIPVGAT
jgi:hypothetical protein